jgi:hypothetical protein
LFGKKNALIGRAKSLFRIGRNRANYEVNGKYNNFYPRVRVPHDEKWFVEVIENYGLQVPDYLPLEKLLLIEEDARDNVASLIYPHHRLLNVIDADAGMGVFTAMSLRYNNAGFIFLLEPSASTELFDFLATNFAEKRTTVFHYAAGKSISQKNWDAARVRHIDRYSWKDIGLIRISQRLNACDVIDGASKLLHSARPDVLVQSYSAERDWESLLPASYSLILSSNSGRTFSGREIFSFLYSTG